MFYRESVLWFSLWCPATTDVLMSDVLSATYFFSLIICIGVFLHLSFSSFLRYFAISLFPFHIFFTVTLSDDSSILIGSNKDRHSLGSCKSFCLKQVKHVALFYSQHTRLYFFIVFVVKLTLHKLVARSCILLSQSIDCYCQWIIVSWVCFVADGGELISLRLNMNSVCWHSCPFTIMF